MTRPSWDAYFMKLAHVASSMGTCSRRLVGAIAVRDRRVLATGFNGAPAGTHHCEHEKYVGLEREMFKGSQDPDLLTIDDHRNPKRESCSNAVHAEANVIAYAAASGIALRGATIFTNTYPCHGCAKQMVSCGIAEVVFDADYNNDPLVIRLCGEAKMVLRRYIAHPSSVEADRLAIEGPMCICTHHEVNHHPLDRSGRCSFCLCMKFEPL